MTDPQENRIRQRAHDIWMANGCPDGCEEDHWRQATAEIGAEGSDDAVAPESIPAMAPDVGVEPEPASPSSRAADR